MPTIIYVTGDGRRIEVEVETGANVMEGAIRNGVPGIDGDCGGAAACGTCHVTVDEGQLALLPVPSEEEQTMLDFVDDVRPNSRLGCQVKMDASLDGLIVTLPLAQH
jgi:ferredoxin, 2Fe-2S